MHEEEDPGGDLDREEEERHASEVVPDHRMGSGRNLLVPEERDEPAELIPLVDGVPQPLERTRGRAHAAPPGFDTLIVPVRSPSTE